MISLLQQTAIPAATEAHQPSADAAGMAATSAEVVTSTTSQAAGAVQAAAASQSSGMPQLDVTTFANQIFWLLVTLLLIWWVLSRIALPRIGGVLADRQNAISGDLGAAEEFKRKARDAEAAYERALADARGQAQGIVAEQKAAIQADVDAAIAHADAEIAARAVESEARIGEIKASSLNDARSVAREVTAELVNVFGGRADTDAVSAAVDQRLEGVAR